MKATILFILFVCLFGYLVGSGLWFSPLLAVVGFGFSFSLFLAYYYDGVFMDDS